MFVFLKGKETEQKLKWNRVNDGTQFEEKEKPPQGKTLKPTQKPGTNRKTQLDIFQEPRLENSNCGLSNIKKNAPTPDKNTVSILNRTSGYYFLVDSGASESIIPRHWTRGKEQIQHLLSV